MIVHQPLRMNKQAEALCTYLHNVAVAGTEDHTTDSFRWKPAPQMHSGKVKQKISCPTLTVRDISVLT